MRGASDAAGTVIAERISALKASVGRFFAQRQVREDQAPRTSRVPFTGRTTAGPYINPDTALTVATVWACMRYLSQAVATPPWRAMRDTGRGGEVQRGHPIDWLLHDRPSPEWSSFQFRETLVHWALRWGNGYAEIERDEIGRAVALWPIHPERVEVKRDTDSGTLYYRVHNGTRASVDLDAMDVFHLRGFGEGPVGVNVMAYAAESIGWAKAAQLFGASFFGQGANPSAVVTMKENLSPDGLKELEEKFNALYKGARNANKVAFLDREMDFKELSTTPDKGQFVETNQHLVEEICRWFGVPPHKVQHMLRATFSNIEHQSIEVVVDTVMPWVKRFEEEANYKLFGRNYRGYYTKMNMNALLRGDTAARAAFYKELRNMGVFNGNDILRLEDLPTIGAPGEKRIVQSQFTTLERIGEDPPAIAPRRPLQPSSDDEPSNNDHEGQGERA